MRKVALTLFCLTCLLLTPALARDLKIGVVDIEDIINKSPEYKRIESSLKRKTEELGRPLQRREQELSQQLQDFQKQAEAGIIKDDARKRKETEFQRMLQDLQKSRDRAAKEFQNYYQREMKPLMDKLTRAVEQVSNEENLDIVFPKAGIFLRDKSLDVTEKVRARFR
ncbi:MAG: OmpH family outer membrane protein [Thermodesulfobacteriota bacterium]